MYRIRLHGRGGQGVKTAGRILGSAFFGAGFEVQDAPRYGAERRGAPLFATVRAAHAPIHERGPIRVPDLVLVGDDTLLAVAAAGVLEGLTPHTVVLLDSDVGPAEWRTRLALEGPIFTLPGARDAAGTPRFVGGGAAAAAARLVGVIPWETFAAALARELAGFGGAAVDENTAAARHAWERFEPYRGIVHEGADAELPASERPDWVDLPFESARIAAPDIHGAATSVEVRTGLWRTLRPVVEASRCRRCNWICTTFCPDGAIAAGDDGVPEIDYDHCKGCLVCVAVCPSHAIGAQPESEAARQEAAP